MALATTLRPSAISYYSAPSFGSSKSVRDYMRQGGGFYPEQQTFLGATIQSFSINGGKGSSPATLSVELIEDPDGTNPTVDDVGKTRGVYDPYHHNRVGDHFSPPGVGMPVFFVYSNPRVTIREAYDDSITVPSNESVLTFGGILQSFHQTNSIGGKTYSVTVSDPRELLSNIYLILNNSSKKIGGQSNNVFNIFGFLEHIPSRDVQQAFDGWQENLIRRDNSATKFAGDDMYYDGTVPSLPTGDDRHYVDYFKNLNTKFPITGVGMSRRSTYGMPYYRIMQALGATANTSSRPEYMAYFGEFVYRGLYYGIKYKNLPPVHPLYFFDHDNIDYLSFLLEICTASGHELNVTLKPPTNFKSEGRYNGGEIVVSFIDRSSESTVGQIRSFINDRNNFPQYVYKAPNGNVVRESTIEKEDLGYELVNPKTSKIIFGGNKVELHTFTSNHDDNRASILSNIAGTNENAIIPCYGFLSDNIFVPTKGKGEWTQILLDSSGLGAFGVGNYYVATERELRYALNGFKAWKDFLLFFNGRWKDKLRQDENKYKYIDESVGDDVYGVKVPRCLFYPDTKDFTKFNPCSPGYGFPLYYDRAVAIGLANKKTVNNRHTALADLQTLQQYKGDQLQRCVNAILRKYKVLEKSRRLTQAEQDAIQVVKRYSANQDAGFLSNAIGKLNNQVFVPATNQKIRLDNAQKVFQFVKNVADEFYGKKWLVRIPQKPNLKYDKKLRFNGDYIYEQGYFGFKPQHKLTDSSWVFPAPAGGNSFVGEMATPYSNVASDIDNYKPGLIVNYNPISDSYVYNYTINQEGGFLNEDILGEAVDTCLYPEDISAFGDENRVKAFVRYDHAEYLNIGGNNSSTYVEEVGDQLSRKNSIPNKSFSVDGFSASVSGQTLIAFMPVSVDNNYYYPLKSITRNNTHLYNAAKVFYRPIIEPVELDASGNIPTSAGTSNSTEADFEMNRTSSETATVTDYARSSSGRIKTHNAANRDRAYALITLPSIVSLKQEKLGDIPKRWWYDVVKTNDTFSDKVDVNTVTGIRVQKKLEMEDYGSQLGVYNPNTFKAAPLARKPDIVCIPLENHTECYGPWVNGPLRYKDANGTYRWAEFTTLGGNVEIKNDDSLCPWNFGTHSLMNKAGEAQAELANTLYLASEKGSVSYPGLPMGKVDVGDLCGAGGPILDGISFDVSIDGVRTSYRFQNYTRSFAAAQKKQQDEINMLKKETLKNKKLDFELSQRGLSKRRFLGPVPAGQGKQKPYESIIDPNYSSASNTDLETSTIVQSPNQDPRLVNSSSSLIVGTSSIDSAAREEYVNNDDNSLSAARDYYNTAESNKSDSKIAISKCYHPLLPSMDIINQQDVEDLYTSVQDSYNIDQIEITYWG